MDVKFYKRSIISSRTHLVKFLSSAKEAVQGAKNNDEGDSTIDQLEEAKERLMKCRDKMMSTFNKFGTLLNSREDDESKEDREFYESLMDGESSLLEMDMNVEELVVAMDQLMKKVIRRSKLDQKLPTEATVVTQKSSMVPQVKVPIFDGNPEEWKSFWNIFSSVIHEQSLPEVQKLCHLMSYLKEKAKEVIKNVEMSHENYELAINLLHSRFGTKDVILDVLYERLKKIKPVSNDPKDIVRLHEEISDTIGKLQAEGEQTDQKALLMLVKEKITDTVMMELVKLRFQNVKSDLQQLLHGLAVLADAAKCLTENTHKEQRAVEPITRRTPDPWVRNLENLRWNEGLARNPQGMCAFCDSATHHNDECMEFFTIEQRENRAATLSLCIRCLRRGHITSQCRYRRPCYFCQDNHHQALCGNRQRVNLNWQRPARNTEGQLPTQNKQENGARSNNVNTVNSVYRPKQLISDITANEEMGNGRQLKFLNTEDAHQQQCTDVVLMTVKTRVNNVDDSEKTVNCYALIDPVSQLTFVTKRLAERLNLRRSQERPINIACFAQKYSQSVPSFQVKLALALT